MTDKWFAGIGSRETPAKIMELMTEFAYQAAKRGVGLRSGAAPGADTAFELGATDAQGPKQIFLPWKGFNGSDSPYVDKPPQLAFDIASTIHPVWNVLKQSAKQLVARNMQQIAGPNLDDPVIMVVCWTKDGCESKETYSIKTGGTGTAIAFASTLDIPIFNIRTVARYKQALEYLEQHAT